METKTTHGRLLSLDILRGITIAGMIMVNNPGSWGAIYAPLGHAQWNGFTPTDLVFPFFMFIMGVSTYMSLRKFNFGATKACVWKIIRRTLLIFAIGLALNWFGQFCRGLASDETFLAAATTHFDTLRILGVLQRLALAYGFAALFAVLVKQKHLVWVIATLLFGYFLLLAFGNGFDKSENNIIAIVDKAILGVSHLYKDSDINGNRIALDPEGLLSTIPSIAHVLIGFLFGKLIAETKDNNKRVEKIMIWGAILAFSGLLLQYGCPINKKIWSSTFVLVTTGFAAQLLALLIWIIDIRKKEKWSRFFHSFGVNPLFVYVLSGVLANLAGNISVAHSSESISLKRYVYSLLLQWVGDAHFGSLLYALLFVTVCWIVGYVLYKKNIYIKI
ncbi:MAG: heparan-alpha-glucosaminide N-acetyltransferase domain-containing protein [Dysgonamonadaceae bacterium]|jgi:predicted acyltransferase|nr:heparan-alpha-glucosaminide N-acetyltransferase domain-containing protein [Dysgonamonadaceae bacterium]